MKHSGLEIAKLTALGVSSLTLAFSTPTQADQIGFLNWADYTPDEAVALFEDRSGIDVIHDTYSEADDAEALLFAGNAGYDLAVVALETADRLREGDKLVAFDENLLPNARGVDAQLMHRFYEDHPSLRGYVQPYLWGYSGLAYDQAKIAARIPDAPLDSWSLLFEPENAARLADCGIYIVNFPEEVVSLALTHLGLPPRSMEATEIDAAFKAIAAIAPYVQDIESEHYDVFTAGEACLALTWNTEVAGVLMNGVNPNLAFVAPIEGTNIWLDVMVVPADAENPAQAHDFANHLLEPSTSALLADWNYTPSAVTAARLFMDPSVAQDPMVFPPSDELGQWFVTRPFDAEEKVEINRRWRRLFLGL